MGGRADEVDNGWSLRDSPRAFHRTPSRRCVVAFPTPRAFAGGSAGPSARPVRCRSKAEDQDIPKGISAASRTASASVSAAKAIWTLDSASVFGQPARILSESSMGPPPSRCLLLDSPLSVDLLQLIHSALMGSSAACVHSTQYGRVSFLHGVPQPIFPKRTYHGPISHDGRKHSLGGDAIRAATSLIPHSR